MKLNSFHWTVHWLLIYTKLSLPLPAQKLQINTAMLYHEYQENHQHGEAQPSHTDCYGDAMKRNKTITMLPYATTKVV